MNSAAERNVQQMLFRETQYFESKEIRCRWRKGQSIESAAGLPTLLSICSCLVVSAALGSTDIQPTALWDGRFKVAMVPFASTSLGSTEWSSRWLALGLHGQKRRCFGQGAKSYFRPFHPHLGGYLHHPLPLTPTPWPFQSQDCYSSKARLIEQGCAVHCY